MFRFIYNNIALHIDNLIKTFPINRTDKGVHALSSTATVDLQQRYNVKTTYFPPKYITTRLNTYFDLAKIDIR